jgi:hypothetical protein
VFLKRRLPDNKNLSLSILTCSVRANVSCPRPTLQSAQRGLGSRLHPALRSLCRRSRSGLVFDLTPGRAHRAGSNTRRPRNSTSVRPRRDGSRNNPTGISPPTAHTRSRSSCRSPSIHRRCPSPGEPLPRSAPDHSEYTRVPGNLNQPDEVVRNGAIIRANKLRPAANGPAQFEFAAPSRIERRRRQTSRRISIPDRSKIPASDPNVTSPIRCSPGGINRSSQNRSKRSNQRQPGRRPQHPLRRNFSPRRSDGRSFGSGPFPRFPSAPVGSFRYRNEKHRRVGRPFPPHAPVVEAGAGGRNRTDETCLEGRSFTTKLRPRGAGRGASPPACAGQARRRRRRPRARLAHLIFEKSTGFR